LVELRVGEKCIAEAINSGGDRVDAADALIQTLLGSRRINHIIPRRFAGDHSSGSAFSP